MINTDKILEQANKHIHLFPNFKVSIGKDKLNSLEMSINNHTYRTWINNEVLLDPIRKKSDVLSAMIKMACNHYRKIGNDEGFVRGMNAKALEFRNVLNIMEDDDYLIIANDE